MTEVDTQNQAGGGKPNKKLQLKESLLQSDEVQTKSRVDYWSSAKLVISLTVNPVLASFFHPLYSIVNAAVLGHADKTSELAGLGLGSLTLGLAVISMTSTFVHGSATLISQAYGDKKYELCHLYQNRQIFLSTFLYIILAFPLIFIRHFYDLIGQDEETAFYATRYVHLVLPSLYFFVLAQTYAIFSCNQRVTWIPLATTVGGAVVHCVMIWLFYFKFEWGYTGVCLATGCNFLARALGNMVLVKTSSRFKSYPEIVFFSKQTFTGYQTQLSLCINSMAMDCWGWWAFDIFTLIASYMAANVIAAQTILRSIGLITYMLPVGIAQASKTVIGNAIGEGSKQKAIFYYKTSQTLGLAISVIQMSVLGFANDEVIAIFTNKQGVEQQMRYAWPILMVYVIFDTAQGVAASVIKGTGMQKYGAIITSTAYWAFGIPVALVLINWCGQGIRGIWYGALFAVVYNFCWYSYMYTRINWDQLIQRAERQRKKDGKALQKKG